MSLCGRTTTQLYRHDLLMLHSSNAKTGGGGAQRFSSMLPTMNKFPGKLEKLVRQSTRDIYSFIVIISYVVSAICWSDMAYIL